MSSCGFLRALVGQRHRVAEDLHERDGLVALHLGVVVATSSGWTSRRACRGPPAGRRAGPAIACSGQLGGDVLDEVALAAARPPPSTMSRARCSRSSCSAAIARGVKRARDDLAELGVVGRVVVDQQEPGVARRPRGPCSGPNRMITPSWNGREVRAGPWRPPRRRRACSAPSSRRCSGKPPRGLRRLLDERRPAPFARSVSSSSCGMRLLHHVGVGGVEVRRAASGARWSHGSSLHDLADNLEHVLVAQVTYRGRSRKAFACPEQERVLVLSMGNPVIIDAVRTPLGKRKGWLAGVHPAVLLGHAQAEVLAPRRARLRRWSTRSSPAASPRPASSPTAWSAAPGCTPGSPSTPAARWSTRSAAPGQQAAHLVHDMIAAGTIDVGIACGVEAMSRIPLGANVPPGTRRPAARRLVHRHAQPVRGRRPDRRAAAA